MKTEKRENEYIMDAGNKNRDRKKKEIEKSEILKRKKSEIEEVQKNQRH